MSYSQRLDARECGFGRGTRMAEQLRQAVASRSFRHGEDAADAANAPVERQLTDRRVLGEPVVWHLTGRGEEGERDREVEARALLSKLGRREVDDHTAPGPPQLGRANRAPDALSGLLARPIGEADDRKARNSAAQVRLDLHPPRLEADEGIGHCTREHGVDGTVRDRTRLCRLCADSDAGDEDVLEELARAPAGPPVDVTAQALLESEPGTIEDGGIEIAPVVDDDRHGRTRR